MTASLHGASYAGEVTARAALAWFAAAPAAGGEIIGYLFTPGRAEWFRCDGATAQGPGRPRDLAAAYELVATDGRRHLRWTHQQAGTGPAVSLSEDPGLLPAGDPLPAGPARDRLDGTASRRLAGQVIEAREGWATLGSARYARCQVPATAEPGQEIWADLAEYTVSDEHGNLSVIDTLLLALRPEAAKERRA
jgi:hypothetical protein